MTKTPTDSSPHAKSQALQWRLQYGKRPPRKTEEELDREKALIEQFLKTQKPSAEQTPATPQPVSRKDQKLIAAFLQKRVQLG